MAFPLVRGEPKISPLAQRAGFIFNAGLGGDGAAADSTYPPLHFIA